MKISFRYACLVLICIFSLTACHKNDQQAPAPSPKALTSMAAPELAADRKITVARHRISTTAPLDQDNRVENLLDNNLDTRWSGEGNPQSVVLDLKTTYMVNQVKIAFYVTGYPSHIYTFDIAVSADSTAWTTVLSNQKSTAGTTELQSFPFSIREARFIRITGHGSTSNLWNSYTEAEVWGSSIGALDMVCDWETGNISQWTGGFSGLSQSAQLAIVTDRKRQGNYAARFTVRPGDRACKDGHCTSGERCELSHWNYDRETLDDDFYYGWSSYFPANWIQPNDWAIFMQWHCHTTISPPVAFAINGNNLEAEFHSGNINSGIQYRQDHVIAPATKGKWHDFMVRIKFRPDFNAKIKVWHRLEGQREFTLALELNVPTLQWTSIPGKIENGNVALYGVPFKLGTTNGWTTGTYTKHGLYRGLTPGVTNILHQDNWNRGTSYNAIRATFD
ncbi:heparin lyase I family protein [Chitinophaga deserti]|uniref:heparin lyase I family protein n=1 Tax=Chitinophaga deserti TaxID=2164099 RepID=UPI000D6DBBD2|nr:heparin lyase I family protein [Chitinophaga deserti]